MEVKDIEALKVRTDQPKATRTAAEESKAPANFSSALASVRISSEATQVTVEKNTQSARTNALRAEANRVISVGNVAKEATDQLQQLVSSISGIVEQAGSEKTPPARRPVLEKEARELVGEIKRVANTSSPDGTRPLAGDKIRLEIEEQLGPALDRILPDTAKDAFGISSIDFSTKDAIISTRVQVSQAAARLEELRKAVDSSTEDIRKVSDTLDIMVQNAEAASASVRDVDNAARLAYDTRQKILDNPDGALKSVGTLKVNTIEELLR